MSKRLQLSGKKFGRLTVVGEWLPGSKWECLCDCGCTRFVSSTSLVSNKTLSCGCLLKEKRGTGSLIHGKSSTKTHATWCAMITRCYNEKGRAYKYYGGRGITVCNRWRDSFENFLEDMGEHPKGLSLDRIDNDKGYSKENCRWATTTEQSRNRSTSMKVVYEGVETPIIELSKRFGIKYRSLHKAITDYGKSPEDAVAKLVRLKEKQGLH